ncbi:hypothetical protein ACN94_13140 [Gordonia paraffinivorans]|uniref:hypothetical protein n=1 Tax=Gordonia paraffinivorans TaxID=175628 RepID=UPI001C92BE6E|nr:hypothetical protein [Gordonia paraffinivorans]MBY4574529.1 hypothetical protein [Gordonia paraffinivorans]
MRRARPRIAALVLAVVLSIAYPAAAQPDTTSGLGPSDTSLMHGDPASTDSTGHRGPGRGARLAASSVPGGACAATFIGSDGMPVSLCTQFVGTSPPAFAAPSVVLFDPRTAQPLASRQLAKGGLLGGVYGYLDDRDRVVVADGTNSILFVAHRKRAAGWEVYVDDRIDVARHIPPGDAITGLAPEPDGRIWFATTRGVVGVIGRDRVVTTTRLPAGEELGNGLSVRRNGVSILTTHALYEMRADDGRAPAVVWRRAYDRGRGRKPGQLTWGSGTTPTYFGPGGDGWVAIVDNADRPQLLVFRSEDGSQVCRMPAFGRSGQGTENSPMAWGDSLVIPSTYGYQYPPMAVTGPSIPADASFTGGMTRIDVSEAGCRRVWENSDRVATLPKLSRADGLIHALGYGPAVPGLPQQVGPVDYIATEFATGRRVETRQVGTGPFDEPLELTGTIAADDSLWQATVGRMLKIAPGG